MAVRQARLERIRPGVWVFLGGCVGTLIRASLGVLVPDSTTGVPLTTLTINLTGAFCLGWLLRTLALSGPDEGHRKMLRLGLGTGVLGGYTTFSTFDVQSLQLMRGHLAYAVIYLAVSLIGGFLAAWAGTHLAIRTRPRKPA